VKSPVTHDMLVAPQRIKPYFMLLTLPAPMLYRTYGGEDMQGYCMKCRTKREMKDAKAITMKNGKPATQGVCPVCGTKMFRIGKG
jgi:hypothetical protein